MHALQGLNYHVPSNQNKKERVSLLKGLNGYINPNELTALMGPSGSGKTTLLDVLAGRKNAGVLEGTVLFGSQKPSTAFLRRFTGYVEQFDTLIGMLTVKEMLLYTAEMKRPVSEPYESKAAAVDDVLEKLALMSCKDTLIGNAMVKGISGGQAKRTNIGIALVTNPRVLFLDEPTSGLDSYTSNEVMRNVKQLADGGVTICATIHSPTAYCFSLFNRLMMLVKGRKRGLFIRERADGLYHVITYLLSKILEEVFLAAIVTAVCAGFVFYGVQLQGAWVIFWLCYFLCLINGIVLAYFIAALSPTMDVANALLPLYAVTLLFFAGFLFRFDNIPPWWKWYSYLNFLRYAWSALMRNQFDAMGDPHFLDTTISDYYNIGGIDPDAHVGFLALFFPVFFMLAWTTMSFKKYADR
ncbi:P-loop containing nucleoside triphosphate hydrolase protein [Dunaliella salina]|uniref:P-loop containing nucleoside triphosphate hydrolase protein n=1 Tax=Dunaliella salina TaxID=3046 RepID=A0ABQ7GDT1_DUNSA|nr:P-loop containing nucleoside triphosphate hydrolase protein [Dunaliella salina]|eukprot:KAF5832767.1 P-loop containing nucleoside triphosphate hydrolase protein [Dunaliella salina]